MFTDRVKLRLHAGKGGNGIVAWRREKYIPKGGPAGGNGGTGGSVYIETSPNVYSLEDYRNKTIIKAKNGADGGANNRKGKNGTDITLLVPMGTLVKSADTGEVLYDLTEEGQKVLLCEGGGGGRGNTTFKTSTNQAPDKCTMGRYGKELEVELELKLIADIGFVGMPNAGKSTLITSITHVPVKIAPYPFTTLRPNLGILQFDDYQRVLIADIPGIIKDAHHDKGLGLSFLKHIERTSVLIYVIDASNEDPFKDFLLLQHEIQAYNPELLKKPFLTLLNKSDLTETKDKIEQFSNEYPYEAHTLFTISAKENLGIEGLKKKMKELVLRKENASIPKESTYLRQLRELFQ